MEVRKKEEEKTQSKSKRAIFTQQQNKIKDVIKKKSEEIKVKKERE